MLFTRILPFLAACVSSQSYDSEKHGSRQLHFDVYHAAANKVHYQNTTNLEFSPTSFTLIHGASEAALVDVPATITQSHELADWVARKLCGKRLSYIYITHGHGDHFMGANILRQRFPGVQLYATPGTISHIVPYLDPGFIAFYWDSLLPGLTANVTGLQFSPLYGSLRLEGHELRPVEVGQGDIMNATVLYVPDLSLVVAGDVVYGNCHQMFEETTTPALQDAWIRALDAIEALRPKVVVPGHMQANDGYGLDHLSSTRLYIRQWKAAMGRAKVWQDVENTMKRLYPNRVGSWILRVSAQTPFHADFNN